MSRNEFYTFAVAGVGGLGQHIARELLAIPGLQVIGLSRSAPKATVEGLDVRAVDYTDAKSLAESLRGVDVVVSTLSEGGLDLQVTLADAAKAAGAKLFVPSEFGMVTEGKTYGIPAAKVKYHRHLESIGLPYVRFYTGMWTDMIFSKQYGYDLANRRVKLAGDGTASQTYTAEADVATYVAYVLTHLTPEKLAWASFRLEGETVPNREVVRKLEAFLGDEVQIEWEDIAELKAKAERDGLHNSIPETLRVAWAEGLGTVGKNDNAIVPGWKPLTVDEALRKYYKK